MGFLSSQQKLSISKFINATVNCAAALLNSVIWPDRTKITLLDWNANGDYLDTNFIAHTPKHLVSLIIWGIMASKCVGRIFAVNGKMNAQKFIDEIFQSQLKLFF